MNRLASSGEIGDPAQCSRGKIPRGQCGAAFAPERHGTGGPLKPLVGWKQVRDAPPRHPVPTVRTLSSRSRRLQAATSWRRDGGKDAITKT